MENRSIKPPIWFWVVAILLLVWNLMGGYSFFYHSFITEETLMSLPENERAIYDEFPVWTKVVFGIAVAAGILGSIGLVMKKKWTKNMYLISLIAIIVQMVHNVLLTSSIEVYGLAQAITMPIIVTVLGITALLFSNFSIGKGWLT